MVVVSVQFPGQSELRASVESSSGSEQCGRLNETQLYSQTKHTSLDEYPWLGRIKYFKNNYEPHYQCLAVLFKAQWALFPAHCVPTTKELEMYSVLFGDWNATDDVKTGDCNNLGECAPPPQEYLIEEIAVHPNYNLRQYAHDIALVKMQTSTLRND
ncbi:phenoloxidase-activating factor 3-like [Scaptodrosophila lebanonensis]|uniref:Phenoloxidase-activating factor 3-like n=1 Tax=Drosophila lebanonensis TaxID=7225 RepID=A0A6J2T6F1_DROLE|nr:phenoloxidase-activating factor 3-like [Scaptodrosophila lebanonensis]